LTNFISKGPQFQKVKAVLSRVVTCLIQRTEAETSTYLIGTPPKTHEEVVRLDISVKETLGMHILHSVDLACGWGVS
jgi:hypothetical protein